jgi:hypothetical protein
LDPQLFVLCVLSEHHCNRTSSAVIQVLTSKPAAGVVVQDALAKAEADLKFHRNRMKRKSAEREMVREHLDHLFKLVRSYAFDPIGSVNCGRS